MLCLLRCHEGSRPWLPDFEHTTSARQGKAELGHLFDASLFSWWFIHSLVSAAQGKGQVGVEESVLQQEDSLDLLGDLIRNKKKLWVFLL